MNRKRVIQRCFRISKLMKTISRTEENSTAYSMRIDELRRELTQLERQEKVYYDPDQRKVMGIGGIRDWWIRYKVYGAYKKYAALPYDNPATHLKGAYK